MENIEEAIMEPTHKMDEILIKNKKFETVNTLLEILCKEMEISPESHPKEVLMSIGKVFEEYYKSMEDFKNLRNGNQGRNGKDLERQAK